MLQQIEEGPKPQLTRVVFSAIDDSGRSSSLQLKQKNLIVHVFALFFPFWFLLDGRNFGNCEEQLQLTDCRSTVGRQITDTLPTGHRQSTNRLPTVSQKQKFYCKTEQ